MLALCILKITHESQRDKHNPSLIKHLTIYGSLLGDFG